MINIFMTVACIAIIPLALAESQVATEEKIEHNGHTLDSIVTLIKQSNTRIDSVHLMLYEVTHPAGGE